jgi:hypothetical protein
MCFQLPKKKENLYRYTAALKDLRANVTVTKAVPWWGLYKLNVAYPKLENAWFLN